jgi:predicted small secreted protein
MRAFVLLLVAVIGLAGCNTMAGLGKDMEKAGEKIQEKAKK